MPRLRLTAENVNRLTPVESGQVLYYDAPGASGKPPALPGFGLRVGTTKLAYFIERKVNGRTVRHTIGMHGAITADQARRQALGMLGQMADGADLNAAKKEQAKAAATARVEKVAAAGFTVAALCAEYIAHLQRQKKQSAKDAAWVFARYVEPSEIGRLPAREVTPRQVTALIRTLVEDGHRRTAAKLRSFLRAAYALAQRAENDPDAPAALLAYGVETNPVASTVAVTAASGTRDVILTDEELGEVLRLLKKKRAGQHDDALAAIELSVWLGGQRIAQVLRLTADDIDLKERTATLLDPKGKREQPRRHVLPLSDPALALVKAILKARRADRLFGDKEAQTTPFTAASKGTALLAEAQTNVAKRHKGKLPARPKIELRDLRRTAESMMAAMGISKDVRAQVLSHGLSGVRQRSYDRHTWMPEKTAALEAWATRLSALETRKAPATNVRPLRAA